MGVPNCRRVHGRKTGNLPSPYNTLRIIIVMLLFLYPSQAYTIHSFVCKNDNENENESYMYCTANNKWYFFSISFSSHYLIQHLFLIHFLILRIEFMSLQRSIYVPHVLVLPLQVIILVDVKFHESHQQICLLIGM